jgi:hypothetical protein
MAQGGAAQEELAQQGAGQHVGRRRTEYLRHVDDAW